MTKMIFEIPVLTFLGIVLIGIGTIMAYAGTRIALSKYISSEHIITRGKVDDSIKETKTQGKNTRQLLNEKFEHIDSSTSLLQEHVIMNLSPAIYDVYNVWFKIHKAINMVNSINNNNQMKQKFVNRAMGSQNELNEKAELLEDEILRSTTLISELIRKIRSGEKKSKSVSALEEFTIYLNDITPIHGDFSKEISQAGSGFTTFAEIHNKYYSKFKEIKQKLEDVNKLDLTL